MGDPPFRVFELCCGLFSWPRPALPPPCAAVPNERLPLQDPDKSEEGAAVKPRTSRRKTAAAAKREERKALVLPPATEKNFIGFLPEEFCAPFRLLFQLFAVAGWP